MGVVDLRLANFKNALVFKLFDLAGKPISHERSSERVLVVHDMQAAAFSF